MSEAVTRADILSIADALYREGEKIGPHAHAEPYFAFSRVLRQALATQPEPGAVPELPEWVREFGDGWRVPIARGRWVGIPNYSTPNDLDRIAEACRILAARERARRAGS